MDRFSRTTDDRRLDLESYLDHNLDEAAEILRDAIEDDDVALVTHCADYLTNIADALRKTAAV